MLLFNCELIVSISIAALPSPCGCMAGDVAVILETPESKRHDKHMVWKGGGMTLYGTVNKTSAMGAWVCAAARKATL